MIPKNGIRSLDDAEQFLRAVKDECNKTDELFACIKDSPKPWTTPYWKKRRGELIGETCASCGSSEGPMVLQHGWKRSRWHEARGIAIEAIKKDHPQSVPIKMRTINVCPVCDYGVIYRKKTDDWVCRKYHCSKTADLSTKKVQDNTAKEAEKRRRLYESWYAKHKAIIDRETILVLANETLAYWSMDGCVTECKKCSFLHDVKNKPNFVY